jgi:hypothetical protein
MNIQTKVSPSLKGFSFSIDDYTIINEWTSANQCKTIISLDHGTETEEYEEVITFYFKERSLFFMWFDGTSVYVQPIVGRTLCYTSVTEALSCCHSPIERSATIVRRARKSLRTKPSPYEPIA